MSTPARIRSRRALGACAVALAVGLAGCGGDEEAATTSGVTGATGPSGVASGVTVGEFLAELQPQKAEILEDLTASTPRCEDVKVDPGFVLLISANAIDAEADAPLESIVTSEC